jgi:hypothetical protein
MAAHGERVGLRACGLARAARSVSAVLNLMRCVLSLHLAAAEEAAHL